MNPHIKSGFDVFLEEQGTHEETFAVNAKRFLAWQLAQAMKREHLSAAAVAERMDTTESEVSRLLDADDAIVQLGTLHRATGAIGLTARLELTREKERFSAWRYSRRCRPPHSQLMS